MISLPCEQPWPCRQDVVVDDQDRMSILTLLAHMIYPCKP